MITRAAVGQNSCQFGVAVGIGLTMSVVSVLAGGLSACGGAPVVKPIPAPQGQATLVVTNAKIITLDESRPTAQALAVFDGKVVALGANAVVQPWIGADTQVLDAQGASVTPGLVDAHCHLYGLGVDLENISLRGAASPTEAAQRVAHAPQALAAWQANTTTANQAGAARQWIVGRGWDQNPWPGAAFPEKRILDDIAPNAQAALTPIALRRIDGHALWANSAALAAAGITSQTPDPPGGKIMRDRNGAPTGVLVDNAMDLVERQIPAPSLAQRKARILAAAQVATRLGLVAVHEMGLDPQTVQAYRELASAAALPLRVVGYAAGDPAAVTSLAKAPPRAPTGRFHLRGVKLFVDGALGSRGARLYEPYADDAQNHGLWVTSPAALREAAVALATAGWDIAVHAIGDAGVGATLDAFAAVRAAPGGRAAILRVEHAQVVAPDDVGRMQATRAIASMQPTHATSDMPWAQARLGSERIRGAYAWRTMLDHDIPLAAGSDFPVEDPTPLLGLYAAVTRQDAKGMPLGGWFADQRLTLLEALAAFTGGAAFAAGEAQLRGRIALGYPADLTIFDRELQPSVALLATSVQMTVVDGQIVFARDGVGKRTP